MAAQKPVLVIDTNIVYSDRGMQASHWSALQHAVAAGQTEVLFPEVVVRETARHMHRHAVAARRAILAALKTIRDDLDTAGMDSDWPTLAKLPHPRSVSETKALTAERCGQMFRDRLTAFGFGVAPLPSSPSHDELVDWSLSAHPPFDDTDKGYRDALIWWTVIEIAQKRPGRQVYFVSNDNDYLKKNEAALKPELAEQVERLGLGSLGFVRTITDALKAMQEAEPAQPLLTVAQQWDLLREPVRDAIFNLVGATLGADVERGQVQIEQLNLPSMIESPQINMVAFNERVLDSVRDAFKGDVLVGVARATVDFGFDGFVSKSDLFELAVLDPELSLEESKVGGAFHAVVECSFTIDPVQPKVLGLDITNIRRTSHELRTLGRAE
ncbi:PIN domain-containing protein [Nocardia salmonicida]|uniref:PIN domain-containing protein n=1 Tax=Nocardia salmonicida TaxID=53431 RepID=UPI0034115A68